MKLKNSFVSTLFHISPTLCAFLRLKKLIIISATVLFITIISFAENASIQIPQNNDYTEHNKTKYALSFLCSDNKVFVTVEFDEKTEKRSHKTWHWDPISQCYKEGDEQETSLVVLIKEESAQEKYFADMWIWRSQLSDPAQIAEDSYAQVVKNKIRNIRRDSGELCWQPVYFDEFVGESVPRFKHKKPSGSYADVSAKSEWNNAKWTVTLSRLNITGHDDDIDFEAGKKYELILFSTENSNLASATKFIIEIPEKLPSTELKNQNLKQ